MTRLYQKGICNECSKEDWMHAKGMCANCYKRVGTPKIKCFKCGELKPHKAKNLCSRCYINLYHLDYIKDWQAKNKLKGSIFKG